MSSKFYAVKVFCLSLMIGSVFIQLIAAQSAELNGSAPTSLPQISDFNISPSELILDDDPLSVVLQVQVSDDDGDIKSIEAVFASPSKSQSKQVLMNQTDLISGDAKNGLYLTRLKFPASSETGCWTLEYLMACDEAGGCRRIDATLAEKLGYQAKLQIVKASDPDSIMESDGSFAGNDIFPDPNELRSWADSENRFSSQKKIIINSIFNRPAICWP
jgi:hypothetical protein